MAEALVITKEFAHAEALSDVAKVVSIRQQLSPRIAIIDGDAGQLDAVRAMPDVLVVSEDALPESILSYLAAAERLFAEAWSMNRRPKSARRGEGLPWDTPGFEPP